MFASAAEVHRVCVEGACAAKVRSNDEDAAAHLAAGDVTWLRVLPLYTHHHQHRRTRHEGIKCLVKVFYAAPVMFQLTKKNYNCN